jgi:hypothetical protein
MDFKKEQVIANDGRGPYVSNSQSEPTRVCLSHHSLSDLFQAMHFNQPVKRKSFTLLKMTRTLLQLDMPESSTCTIPPTMQESIAEPSTTLH